MMTIYEIKQHMHQYDLPYHWIYDWLLFVIEQNDAFLITHSHYKLTEKQWTTFKNGIQKMQNGTPVQYLTHTAYFWSMPFYVNQHTLIPRPDTETLVETAIQHIHNPGYTVQILDMGTGTGCIAIALYHALKNLPLTYHITATDQSYLALQVAQKNADTLNADIHFIHSDWYQNIPKNARFDYIISNPPYIAKNDPHILDLHAEPISALVSDNDGLYDIEHIIKNSRYYLNQAGMVLIEHGYNQKQAVQDIFTQYDFKNIHTVQDLGGNDRVTYGTYF